MNKEEKRQVVEALKETFQGNSSVLLLAFREIEVTDLTELRRKVAETGSGYRVVKNTLALRAAEDTPVDELSAHFKGPSAIAYTDKDPVALAKLLRGYVKDHPGLEFKAGVLEGAALSSDDIEGLAEMPSRPELISKLAYLLNAPLTSFARTLQAPLINLGIGLKALGEQKNEN